MLVFEKVTSKNFMSIGNSPVEIVLNSHGTTLITAKNGAGKSAVLLDTISFALYNRAYRNITKPQLVNSINQKQLLVSVELSTNGKKYKIVRGIKPNVFEIYENGTLVNQDPTSRDYQKYLEQHILKMNYRAFTQVVVMGSASYVPFMKLKPQDRRDFIEDLFDIRVFSVMGKMLSIRIKESKETIRDMTGKIESIREILKVMESNLAARSSEQKEKATELKASIESAMQESEEIKVEISSLKADILNKTTILNAYTDAEEEVDNFKAKRDALLLKIEKLKAEIEKFNSQEHCPTCSQHLTQKIRDTFSADSRSKLPEFEDCLEKMNFKLYKMESALTPPQFSDDDVQALRDKVTTQNQKMYGNTLIIERANKELLSLVSSTSISDEKAKMREEAKKLVECDRLKKEAEENLLLQNSASVMLQDSGIKSKVIKQYIPSINKLVNRYLTKLDFFCHFTMDEEFNEVVKSRHRDTFSYDSFSQGERQKIDLSILFAFRDIAAMKNSVHTNLIILDEVLDSALDSDVLILCFDLLKTFKKSNVFVVSHRENISDRFNHHIQLMKKNNFTKRVE